MTELKTLKDLESEGVRFKADGKDYSLIFGGDLRSEAIKWAKFIKNRKSYSSFCLRHVCDFTECPDGKCAVMWLSFDEYEGDASGAIKIIKKFFNLSEEDLK